MSEIDSNSAYTAYCENCKEERAVRVVEEQETLELDGTSYTYAIHTGYCTVCGEKATPQAMLEANQRSFSAAVRTRFGLVSQEIVEGVAQRYNIKPRPLSALLGWGTHTYPRFVEGDIPNKSFSDKIINLWNSPLSYLMILLDNGSSISNVALKKSSAAAKEALLNISSKAERAAAYLIGKTESNSSLALQKELYYAQGLMMAFYGKQLFSTQCEAWQFGPVFPEVWRTIHPREIREEALIDSNLDECVRPTFTEEELAVLDAVASNVGCYSPFILRDITHSEQPWLDARGSLPDNEASANPITEASIEVFFVTLRKRYRMEKPADIRHYMIEAATRARG